MAVIILSIFYAQEAGTGIEQWLQTANTPTLLTLIFGAAVVVFFIARQINGVVKNSLDNALADNTRLRLELEVERAEKAAIQALYEEQLEKRRENDREYHLARLAHEDLAAELRMEIRALKRRLGE